MAGVAVGDSWEDSGGSRPRRRCVLASSRGGRDRPACVAGVAVEVEGEGRDVSTSSTTPCSSGLFGDRASRRCRQPRAVARRCRHRRNRLRGGSVAACGESLVDLVELGAEGRVQVFSSCRLGRRRFRRLGMEEGGVDVPAGRSRATWASAAALLRVVRLPRARHLVEVFPVRDRFAARADGLGEFGLLHGEQTAERRDPPFGAMYRQVGDVHAADGRQARLCSLPPGFRVWRVAPGGFAVCRTSVRLGVLM